MNRNRQGLVWAAALACGLLAGRIVSAEEETLPAPVGSLIETYGGTIISQTQMPGIRTQGGVRFTSTDRYSSINFEPGPAIFNGAAIDFAGHEGAFLASQMQWQWEFATGPTPTPAPATVECSGDGAMAGAFNGAVTEHETGTQILAGFSPRNYAVTPGSPVNAYGRSDNVNSPEFPQLNGATLESLTSATIEMVDAGTGLLTASFQGQIFASSAAMLADAAPKEPGLPSAVLALLAFAMITLGARQILRGNSRTIA